MGPVKCLPVLFVKMLLVSVAKAVLLMTCSNAVQEMMEEMAEIKRQILEQSQRVRNHVHNLCRSFENNYK